MASNPDPMFVNDVQPTTTEALQEHTRLTMPGPNSAEEIEAVSPEGKPADANTGPGSIWLMLVGAWVLLAIVAVVIGSTLSWAMAALMLVLGTLGMIFNPVVLASMSRAKERREVLHHHEQGHPRADGTGPVR